MPYISAAEVKQIRVALKKAFPEYKFSVTKQDFYKVTVSILKGPRFTPYSFLSYEEEFLTIDLNEATGRTVDHSFKSVKYSIADRALFVKIEDIIKTGSDNKHFDRCDITTDYFEYAFQYEIKVGKYNQQYQVV